IPAFILKQLCRPCLFLFCFGKPACNENLLLGIFMIRNGAKIAVLFVAKTAQHKRSIPLSIFAQGKWEKRDFYGTVLLFASFVAFPLLHHGPVSDSPGETGAIR